LAVVDADPRLGKRDQRRPACHDEAGGEERQPGGEPGLGAIC
jgi:hypothetical protein